MCARLLTKYATFSVRQKTPGIQNKPATALQDGSDVVQFKDTTVLSGTSHYYTRLHTKAINIYNTTTITNGKKKVYELISFGSQFDALYVWTN